MYLIYYSGPDWINHLVVLHKFKSKREGRKKSIFLEITEGKDSDVILERMLRYCYFGKFEFSEDIEKRKQFLRETYKEKETEFYSDTDIWRNLYLINSIEDMFKISCTNFSSLIN